MGFVCYNKATMQQVVVTGGAGFIGSHLCKRLLSGRRVLCIDNLSTGRKTNIVPLLTDTNFRFIAGDVTDAELYEDIDENISQIYHLASPASVDYVTAHPIEAATVNSFGTQRILEFATKKNARVLFASSSEVYGDPQEHPQKESYWGNTNSVGVRSGYDEGKRFGEALTAAYQREKKLDARIARIFNTYGPNASPTDGRVIPRFVRAALSGTPLPVHGAGSQTRSFCYVSDLVDGLVKLMESDITTPVNLGNPSEITINEVAKKIIELTGSKSVMKYEPRPQDDPSRRLPDITVAKTKLHWQPTITLGEGLLKTIEFFRSQT